MKDDFEYYENVKDWNFDEFGIYSESLTNCDMYAILNNISNEESKILDLGTGGGEKLLKYFPKCREILGTDYSPNMIETANNNLKKSLRSNITFRVMDNLNMDVNDNYYDIVVARNTVTDKKQIYKCLKRGGYLLIHGVDKDDCWGLKLLFGRGQCFNDVKSISIKDYEEVLSAGFKDVELIPIYEREYFKDQHLFKKFLRKVPIIDNSNDKLDDNILDEYIKNNTFNKGVRLLRRYYIIVCKK